MEESVTTGLMAVSVNNHCDEIQDFERVVEAYRPSVFRFALASLRDPDAAETLTQDCFLRAYRNRQQFRGDASVSEYAGQD
jgi:RNA polymerase sigma-70 factor (ECF subfamily)